MSEEIPRIRRANREDIWDDVSEVELLAEVRIEASPDTAPECGHFQWSEPTVTFGPGDWTWWLRAGDIPVRVCVRGGQAPVAQFNALAQPGEETQERIVTRLAEMLSDGDSDAVQSPDEAGRSVVANASEGSLGGRGENPR